MSRRSSTVWDRALFSPVRVGGLAANVLQGLLSFPVPKVATAAFILARMSMPRPVGAAHDVNMRMLFCLVRQCGEAELDDWSIDDDRPATEVFLAEAQA